MSNPQHHPCRQRILNHIENAGISNPVVLNGHSSFAYNLLLDFTDPASEVIGSEFVRTSITAGGMEPFPWPETIDQLDWVHFADGGHGGYTANEITADLWRTDYYLMDNMEDPDSDIHHLAADETETGHPGLQEG